MPELPFPDPELTDGVVTLRAWRPSDHAQRFAGFSDPLCQRFSWGSSEPFTEQHQLSWAGEEEEAARKRGEAIGLAIVDTSDRGRVWGGASIYDFTVAEGRARVGYWLAGHARGRGNATRTVGLLVRWAFTELAVARLELTCGPDNRASQRVAERSGFTREGLLRAHLPFKGGRRDSVLFSLLPTDPASR
ncbi:GNAT family N-acetyltransferase [Nocardia sp. NPDC051750]|uniref:GNAT family N-acetyltransferase n=1 Tax=Nocardia sp. NPDC051750 TaxID=3364325 RepID=UPI00378A3277